MRPRKAHSPAIADPRERLIQVATLLFAAQGIDAVTTREICAAAELNPGAIHYHFGDKEGLYREVIYGPIAAVQAHYAGFDDPTLSLEAALSRFLAPFLTMDQQDDGAVMRLYLRELLDPSPVFTQAVQQHIGPNHHALAALLARHAGVAVDCRHPPAGLCADRLGSRLRPVASFHGRADPRPVGRRPRAEVSAPNAWCAGAWPWSSTKRRIGAAEAAMTSPLQRLSLALLAATALAACSGMAPPAAAWQEPPAAWHAPRCRTKARPMA